MNDSNDPAPPARAVRWTPMAALAGIAAVYVAVLWLWRDLPRQRKVEETASAAAVVVVLIFLWLWLRSNIRRKTAGWITAIALILAGTGLAFFKVKGYTGDLVPILGWRWDPDVEEVAGAEADPDVQSALTKLTGFPQFLGPTRDGRITGVNLSDDWKTKPPRLLWRKAAGPSVAGVAISGRNVLTLDQDAAFEAIVCRDLVTGTERWRTTWPGRYDNQLARVGPRTTPAVHGDRVFAAGALGDLICASLADGKILWQHNVINETHGVLPQWGASGSPLVSPDGSVVIVSGGGPGHSITAWNTGDGKLAWAGGDDQPGYSSPQWVTLDGVPQVLIFNETGLVSHEPGTGRRLWFQTWPAGAQRVSDPRVVAPDALIVSSGYGIGSDLIKVKRNPAGEWAAVNEWHSQRLKSKFAPLILHPEGRLLGLDDGVLAAMNPETGERLWKSERYGHGQMLLADNRLVIMAENGEVVLVDPKADEPVELARFAALEEQTWNPHALSGHFLVVRNAAAICCWLLP